MSILLDSLRKSEAQRSHREAPTIHSTRSFDAPAEGSRGWPAMVMILLAAGAVAWFGLKQYSAPEAGATLAQEQVEPAETTPAAAQAQPAGEPQVRTPVERLAQTPANQRPAGETDNTVTANPSPADRIASFAAAEEPQESTPEPSQQVAQSGQPVTAPEDEFAEASVPEAPFTRVEPLPQERSRREAPPANEPRSYWQLPQSWRSEMPEFRISVLVYADEPEDRFLFINGERKKEGDSIDGGVVLEEIRRDGAVFSYRNQQFLVKS